jgi:hypothetical protein
VRAHHVLLLSLALLVLSGCSGSSPACPPPTAPPALDSDSSPAEVPTATRQPPAAPAQVEIAGRTITVDQVVDGPLCDGAWSGTVYVTCDVQVLPWEELPTFLEDCDLEIAPDTVVYVAYHGDAPYYNGCSCHTGEIAEP